MENVPMLSEPNVPMLSEPNVPMLSEPELLRYLNGEISFETWLKNQNIDYTESQDNNPLASSLKEASESLNFGCKLPDDESTIFSSWGSIFSDKNEKKKKVKKKRISEKIDLAEESQILELKNTLPTAAPAKFFDTPLRSVSFSNVSDYNAEDDSLQGVELKSLMLKLPSVISTSTANKHIKFKKQKDLEQDIFQDLHNFQFRKRTYAVRQKLSEMARLQLGQANMLVAKGDFKQAAEICMDVVKEVPSSGEPFKTLSFIYDEQGNKEMALQYALVSAFLDCKDAQEWRDLAQRCINEGSETQALACYDRACKVLSTDACLQWDRATMYFEKQDYRKTLDILFTIMKIIKPTHLEDFMVIAKEISKLYHKFGLTDRSREMLEVACKMCINIKDYESIHLLSEMYMAIKEYDKLLKLIVKTCDVKLPEDVFKQKNCGINFSEIAAQVSSIQFTDLSSHIVAKLTESSSQIIDQPSNTVDICSKSVESFYVPVELPLDIRVKLAQGLVYLNELNYVESITEPLFSEDLNDVGDLMLDLAESYYETGNYQLALKYLLELVDCAKFNQAAVWLKIAESFDYLNEKEKSIDAYYMVLSLAPQHVSVRMTLASLLRSVGRADEAVTVISEYEVTFNDNSETCVSELSKLKVEECEMLYKKCLKLYDECNYKDFLCDGYILIHNYLLWSFGYQKQMLIGRAQMWQFLLKMLNVAMDLKEHQKAIKLVNKAILFKPYQESRKYRLELDYLQTTIYFVAGEYAKAFESFRILIMHETEEVIDKNTIWNLFALITNKMMDKRHHRYVLRLLFRKPLRVPLIMINGNNSFVSGTYKYAIGEYLRCFREWPTNPLTSLLLAVSYLHLACQKFHKTRHASIIQGLIFMFQYMSLRKENQESHYNMGRAFHQIGLVHFATFYYNKALEFPMHNENDSNKAEYHPFIDLHREAACNLAMIYKASGNIELAKKTFLLHEELKKKLNDCKYLQKIQDEEFKLHLSAQTKQVNDMTSKCFSSFLETSKKVISLYDTNNESSQFFFQYPLDEVFAEEEKFTSALAEYTKKQFFQGISDIAETKDTSQYGLLDLSNPDTQILKGESHEEKMKHRNELLRLQSQYMQSEMKRLQSEVNFHGVKKALETAEEQLKMLTSDSFNIDEIDFDKEIRLLTAELKSKKESCDNLFNGEIKTILLELEQLYSTKIIDGNCDLKIARQKYFLEKLDEVIKHLTQQSSRQHCLSLMYELELKEHKNTYYLLASVKTLLSNEIKSMESRIKLLNEPYFKDIPKDSETILSNDTFANRLYDAIVPPSDKVVLYKTYQDIADHAKQAVPLESYDELEQLKDLQTALKNVEHFLQNNYLKEGEQISSLTSNIEENLSHSELQVNEIIKDIVYKRKILSMDPYKNMERDLFPYFFNNPALLKQCFNEVNLSENSLI